MSTCLAKVVLILHSEALAPPPPKILSVDQAGLEPEKSTCLCLLSDGIKDMYPYCLAGP
jgi:hypothetical protein